MPETKPGSETFEIKCPVCGTLMKKTDKVGLFLCPIRRKAYPQGFGGPIPYYDCALELDENGEYSFQEYEFPPFKVIILGKDKTTVHKIIRVISDEHFGMESDDPFLVWEEAFSTPSAIELSIQDFDACVKKLYLLTTFS